MDFFAAPELKKEIELTVRILGLSYIKTEHIHVFESRGSKGTVVARIWSMPRIWQLALGQEPHYCLEVIKERFDRLSGEEKRKVLIHELLHIPKNFSGALLSHNHNGRRINRKVVDNLYLQYLQFSSKLKC